tara:strand:+ start:241 stop:645 length:405 start_codon:yes stop_codon:yes gene_type:complete
MNKIISLISGAIFGFGLTVSSMTNPAKVLGFLNLFGQWDPSLIFVMIGAIIVSSPFFFLLKDKEKPLFAQSFSIPEIKKIDTKLIIGSSLFGVGWGSVGLCPGPALSSLALLNNYSLAFIVSMFLGFLLAKVFN